MSKIFTRVLVLLVVLIFSNTEIANAEECEYIDRGRCIEGLISNETWWTPQPTHTIGKAVWYAPGLMKATADVRGMDLEGFVGGVSLFSPADIGEVVWLKRPSKMWEGPYLVVDASQRGHMWVTVTQNKEVVEVDFPTARRWGMVEGDWSEYSINDWMIRNVQVYKGTHPPFERSDPERYDSFFYRNLSFTDRENAMWSPKFIKFSNYNEYRTELITSLGLDDTIVQLIDSESRESREFPNIPNIPITPQEAHAYTNASLATMDVVEDVTWEVDCDDGNAFTGFEMIGHCVPGVISFASWMLRYPKHTIGVATYYAPGVMEVVLENRGLSIDGHKGALVFLSCAHIGESAWIRRPGMNWEGSWLIVDCVQPYHFWANAVGNHLFIEVDYDVWQEWNTTTGTQQIEVCLGDGRCGGAAVDFWQYWAERVSWMIPSKTIPKN